MKVVRWAARKGRQTGHGSNDDEDQVARFRDWDLPPPLSAIRSRLHHHADGDRQLVKILGRVPKDGVETVAEACAEALEAGIANGDVVLAILARKCLVPQ